MSKNGNQLFYINIFCVKVPVLNFNSRTENNNTDINKQELKPKQSNPILTSDIVIQNQQYGHQNYCQPLLRRI